MGIYTDGSILVGAYGDDFKNVVEDGLYDFIEDNDMDSLAPFYDAPIENCKIGFTMRSVWDIDKLDEMAEEARNLAKKFKEITGIDAKLFGTQYVY